MAKLAGFFTATADARLLPLATTFATAGKNLAAAISPTTPRGSHTARLDLALITHGVACGRGASSPRPRPIKTMAVEALKFAISGSRLSNSLLTWVSRPTATLWRGRTTTAPTPRRTADGQAGQIKCETAESRCATRISGRPGRLPIGRITLGFRIKLCGTDTHTPKSVATSCLLRFGSFLGDPKAKLTLLLAPQGEASQRLTLELVPH